jgi:hypothetical protein
MSEGVDGAAIAKSDKVIRNDYVGTELTRSRERSWHRKRIQSSRPLLPSLDLRWFHGLASHTKRRVLSNPLLHLLNYDFHLITFHLLLEFPVFDFSFQLSLTNSINACLHDNVSIDKKGRFTLWRNPDLPLGNL